MRPTVFMSASTRRACTSAFYGVPDTVTAPDGSVNAARGLLGHDRAARHHVRADRTPSPIGDDDCASQWRVIDLIPSKAQLRGGTSSRLP